MSEPSLAQPTDLTPRSSGSDPDLAGLDLNACLTCGLCASACPLTGQPDLKGLEIRKVLRLLALGLKDEVAASDFPWLCTGCGRCAEVCPANLDLPGLTARLKALRPRAAVPGVLHKGLTRALDTGNNLAVPRADYLFLLYDLGRELAQECCPGFHVPIDQDRADLAFFPNSKEVFADNEDLKWWWKIFYAAGESWTVPSENWEAVDWGLFSGNAEASRTLARRKVEFVRRFGIRRMMMPDCGGASYGCRRGLKSCFIDDPTSEVDYVYLHQYLKELLQPGRIKVDKSINAGRVFTWHDSCKHGRELARHFGHGLFEEPRWIIRQCVDEFVELEPNRMRAFCCGAGGGMWPLPFEAASAYEGRLKHEQIKASGANVVVVGCSNCRDQLLRRLPRFYQDYRYEVKYLWQLVAESLILEPWSDEEVARAQVRVEAQWRRLDFDPARFEE